MSVLRRLAATSRIPAIGLILVTGLTLGASGINLIAQALLAYRFGVGVEIDSYAFSLSVPVFIAGLIASIVSYTVVPLIATENADRERQAGICVSTAMIGGGVAALLAFLSAPGSLLQPLALPGGSTVAANDQLPAMIMIAWLVAAAQVMGAVMTAQLNACRRPIAAALLGLLPGLCTVIALVALARAGVIIASLGLLAGSGMAAAAGLYLQRTRFTARPTLMNLKAEATTLMRKALWAALALSCFSSFAISDAYWAVRMPEGSLASLSYVHRLTIGIGSLVVAGPSAMFVPRFAAFAGTGDKASFARLLRRTLMIVWGLGTASIIFLYIYSERMIALLFRRGSFGDGDVAMLSLLFRTMAPGFVAMLSVVILMRALFCLKRTERVAALLGSGWCLLYFGLSGFLHWQGAVGIARSYSIAWIALAGALLAYTFHKVRAIDRAAQPLARSGT